MALPVTLKPLGNTLNGFPLNGKDKFSQVRPSGPVPKTLRELIN